MPSFTSSSDCRAPDAPYFRQWLLTIVVALAILAGFEWYSRQQGHLPSVTDNRPLWATQRDRIYAATGEQVIVLVGASRSQTGIVPDVLEEHLPGYRVVHLSLSGLSGLATLRDLAADPDFRGTVIFDVMTATPLSGLHDQQPYVDYYHHEWSHLGRLDKQANLAIQLYLQERFVMFSSQMSGNNLFRPLFVPLQYVITRPDRYQAAYYRTRLSPERLAWLRSLRGLDQEETDQAVPVQSSAYSPEYILTSWTDTIQPLVEQLHEHGAQVIFLHMPLSEEAWLGEEQAYPKDRYWDQLGSAVNASFIHFQDAAGLNGFICPDGSHLDAADAPVFTARLADELLRRQVVTVPPSLAQQTTLH